VEGGDTVCI